MTERLEGSIVSSNAGRAERPEATCYVVALLFWTTFVALLILRAVFCLNLLLLKSRRNQFLFSD